MMHYLFEKTFVVHPQMNRTIRKNSLKTLERFFDIFLEFLRDFIYKHLCLANLKFNYIHKN